MKLASIQYPTQLDNSITANLFHLHRCSRISPHIARVRWQLAETYVSAICSVFSVKVQFVPGLSFGESSSFRSSASARECVGKFVPDIFSQIYPNIRPDVLCLLLPWSRPTPHKRVPGGPCGRAHTPCLRPVANSCSMRAGGEFLDPILIQSLDADFVIVQRRGQ